MEKVKQGGLCSFVTSGVLFAFGVFLFVYGGVEALERGDSEREKHYVSNEVLVKYKKDAVNLRTTLGKTASAFYSLSRQTIKKRDLPEANISVITITDGTSVERKIGQLRNDPSVEYAEPNYLYPPTVINTDDTFRGLLWGLDNTGQTVTGDGGTVAGTADADMDVPEAWTISEGQSAPAVIVAVIDTGVLATHPDLAANMWDGSQCKNENGAPLGGCRSGYDFEFDDPNPDPTDSVWGNYYAPHGTHVSATIAAVKNNGKGIVGVAPHVKIMALKYYSDDSIVRGIDFARQNGARIINASFGGPGFSQAQYDAIARFRAAGGIFVAAAGNNGRSNDSLEHYPSGYNLDNIIAVAATDQNDALATFSNYGATSVDVGAPGVNIYSAVLPGNELVDDTPLLNETFESIVPPNIPSGWVKENHWGTATLTSGTRTGTVLYGDAPNRPYAKTANATITSPTINVSGASNARLKFFSRCDTEYNTSNYTDYMALETSADGTTFTQIGHWDEIDLDTNLDSSGSAERELSFSIAQEYLTGTFRFRFRWIANGNNDTGSSGEGCFIDDLQLLTQRSVANNERYVGWSGTSMATPHVTGLAALIRGYKPNISVADMRTAILTSGDSVAALQGKTTTGKRVNAHKAFQLLTPRIMSFRFATSATQGTIDQSAGTITLTVPFGTAVNALTPAIEITGSSVSPASGGAQNFTQAVQYTVTALDGSTKVYTVTVTVAIAPILSAALHSSTPAAYYAVAGTVPDQGALLVQLTASATENILVDQVVVQTQSDAHDAAVTSATLWTSAAATGPWTQKGGMANLAGNGTNPGTVTWQLAGDSRIQVAASQSTYLLIRPQYAGFQSGPVSGLSAAFALSGVRGVGATSSTVLSLSSSELASVQGNTVTLTHALLALASAGNTPSGAIAGANGVMVFRMTAQAQGDGNEGTINIARIDRMDVTVSKSSATVNNLAIYPEQFDNNNLYKTSCNPRSQTTWRCVLNTTNNNQSVSEGSPQNFVVRADLGFSAAGAVQFNVVATDVVWNDGVTQYADIYQTQRTVTGGVLTTIGSSGTVDATRPSVSSLVFTDTAARNRLDAGDILTLTFSEPIDATSIAQTLVPGGSALTIVDSATGDVSLAQTTGIVTIKNIATVDVDAGNTPDDTAYNGTLSLDASAMVLTITLTARTSGSGLLSGNKQFLVPAGIATTVRDVNNNALSDVIPQVQSAPHQTAKKIVGFSVLNGSVTGTINEQSRGIALTVPFGTDVTALSPTIEILGSSVSPASGVAQNFTNPVVYTVTASGLTTQTYVVTVTVAPSSAKRITLLTITRETSEYVGTIDEEQKTISVIVPFDTTITALTPTITHTGASMSPASGSAQNFTTPVVYTVTAQDGSRTSYTVTVSVAQEPRITSFAVTATNPGSSSHTAQGTIDQAARTITVVFPFGTSISNLTSAIQFTGASINPAVGALTFQAQQTYTVTSQDRSQRSYTLNMSVARNPAKRITAFSFQNPQVQGIIHESRRAIVVPIPPNTTITALTPTITHTGASIFPASGSAQNFTNPMVYTVTAEDSTTQQYTVMLKMLTATDRLPDTSGRATATREYPHVVVRSLEEAVTVSIDEGITDPGLDAATLVSSGTGVLPRITMNHARATVSIPDSTTLTSSSSAWDGVLKMPTPTTSVTLPAVSGKTRTLSAAVEVGSATINFSLNKGVAITLVGEAGKRAGYIRPGGEFTEITSSCFANSQATGDALPEIGTCKIDAGSDLVIWTKHFTTFAAYSETGAQSSSSGSSGGGGGSSGGGGGSSSGSSTASSSVKPTPPQGGFTVVINNDEAMTSSREVTLTLNAGSDTAFVLIANNEQFDWAKTESFTKTKQWVVSDGFGTKTVYVKFLHSDGSAAKAVSDSILYLQLKDNVQTVLNETTSLPVKKEKEKKEEKVPSQRALRLSGKIILQVQENGEAWYVYPQTKQLHYLGRPADAFAIMRSLGIGVTNGDIRRIPVANLNIGSGPDQDGDGLSDSAEQSLGTDPQRGDSDSDGYSDYVELLAGYNPLKGGGTPTRFDSSFARRYAGFIFLQVQSRGEAWYVNPTDLKRYYLGRPDDAFRVMRSLGLGISNVDLADIVKAGNR